MLWGWAVKELLQSSSVLVHFDEQKQLHSVAFASRALSSPEKNYCRDLSHSYPALHAYLYGHNITVLTDHVAVKVILETLPPPPPSGKHARWYVKVFASGVRRVDIDIVYCPGFQNAEADALSQNPTSVTSNVA